MMRLFAMVTFAALALIIGGSAVLATPDIWRSEGWKTDFAKTAVPLGDIVSGGVTRDQIPAIDKPRFELAGVTERYALREPVIELRLGEKARAYPLSVLTWHEIVNDQFEGRPVAVTYCPLCNASIVFDRRLDGQVLDFGTSGKLRNSDLVMYDRQSQTWWQQFTGDAIVGKHTGNALKMIPSRVVAFADFRARYPDGEVLIPAAGAGRPYGRNPYVAYDSGEAPYGLFRGPLPENINPMARVVIAKRDGAMVAVALEHLRKSGRIEKGAITLSWSKGVASALDHGEIAKGRDVGAVKAVDSKSGALLVHDVTFAFVLFAFHPELPVVTQKGVITLRAQAQGLNQNSQGGL